MFYYELVSHATKILIVLIIILPITELFKLLDQVISGNLPVVTLLTLMLYGTIASFPMILTIALFLTITITLNRYSKDHELVIWLACGISPFYWLRQVIFFSLPLVIICGICSIYITPWASLKSEHYANFLLKQQINTVITPGVFKETTDHTQVFYLEHYSLSQGSAQNLFIHYMTQGNEFNTHNITAHSGHITNESGIVGIKLYNGNWYDLLDNQQMNIIAHFNSLSVTIGQQYKPHSNEPINISTLPISELLHNQSTHAQSQVSWRISIALMMFVMAILVVPISMQIGRMQNNLVFILPPIFYAVYQNLLLTVNGYIESGSISIVMVLLLHASMIVIAFITLYIKTFPKGYLLSKNKR